MRIALAIGLVILFGCARAREQRAQEHLRNELAFLVPYVDLDGEERAVRNVLAQRKLALDERLRGNGFVALSASSFDQKRSAVRIITGRGVVAAEDGDLDDLFGARRVALTSLTTGGPGSEILLGIAATERGREVGCARFLRVRPDGNLANVDVRIDRFGSRACLSGLRRDEEGKILASVGWPSLSAGVGPLLFVDMRIESGRLDQPEPDELRLRVEADDTAFLARESARLDAELSRAVDFAQRQAAGVALAAVALASNQGVDLQLAAYQSALGASAARGPAADLVALTREHIAHGWDDPLPEGEAGPGDPEHPSAAGEGSGGEAPDPRENVIVEPAAAGAPR